MTARPIRPRSKSWATAPNATCGLSKGWNRVSVDDTRHLQHCNEVSKATIRVIFDRDEALSRCRHVGYSPKDGSEIKLVASAATGLCGLMVSPARDSGSPTGA